MPHFVSRSLLLGNVDDVFNAVSVEGDFVGETLFYGRGAGSLPTASAVCGDVIELAACKKSDFVRPWVVPSESIVVPYEEVDNSFIFWNINNANVFEGLVTENLKEAVIVKNITDAKAVELAKSAGASVMNYLG